MCFIFQCITNICMLHIIHLLTFNVEFRKQVLYSISLLGLFSIHYVTKIHLCCYMQFTHFHCYKNFHFVKISLFIYPFFTLWAFELFPNSAAVNTLFPVLTPTISHTIVKAMLCFQTCISGKVIMIIIWWWQPTLVWC